MNMISYLQQAMRSATRTGLAWVGWAATIMIVAASGRALHAQQISTARPSTYPSPKPAVTSGRPASAYVQNSPQPSGVVEGEVYYQGMGGFDAFDDSSLQFAGSGMGCPPGWVATADALFLNREGDAGNSLSTIAQLDDFGYEVATRAALNRRYDCLIGWELAFVGPFEWTQSTQVTGAGLSTILVPAGINLSAFSNGVFQQQSYRSRFHSVEFSQKWWGWDVIATSAGVRYISVEEDLQLLSTNNLAQFGQLNIATNNHLVGGQLGMDLNYPAGELSSTLKLRGSAYANLMDTNTLIANTGVTQVNTSDDDSDFAALLEIGYHVSYYLTPRIALRAGYEAMWLFGVALAPDQLLNPVSVASGSRIDRDGDIFYHGGTAGVEVTW